MRFFNLKFLALFSIWDFFFFLIISLIFLLISLSGSSIRKSENFIVILPCSFLLKFFFQILSWVFLLIFSQSLLYIMRYFLAFFSHLQFPRCSSPRYFTVTTLTSISGITASDCFLFSTPPHRLFLFYRYYISCACVFVKLLQLWPYGLPPRLLCPWDFPGKKTEGDCHAFLQGTFPTWGSNSHPYVSCIGRCVIRN